jgi:fibronectin-binding autotransporter adhesin
MSIRSGTNATVNFNVGTGSTLTINIPIQGMGSATGSNGININGSGTTIFGGTNTYTGPTSVNGGTLRYGASNVISTGVVNVSGGTLDLQSYSDSVGTVTVSSGAIIGTGTLTTTGNFTLTNSGSISAVLDGASKTLTKSGTGTVYLNAANTYTGVTTISGGILSTNSIAAAGSASGVGSSASPNSNLVIDGGTLQYTGTGASTNRRFTVGVGGATFDASGGYLGFTSGSAMAVTGTGARTITLTGTSTSNSTVLETGIIDDPTGGATSIVKNGSGNWILTGTAGISNYTGTTTLNAGILGVKGDTSLGNSTIVFNGGGLSAGSAADRTIANNISATGDISLGGIYSYNLTLLGAVNLGGAARNIILAANSHTISGKISNGGVTLNSSSSTRKLTLSGSNDYAGGTTVNGGILTLGNANALGTGGLTLNGGTVDLNGNSIALPSLSASTGTVVTTSSAAGTSTLSINTSGSSSFAGAINNNGSGVIALVKDGTGFTGFSSVGSTFSGGVTLNNGTIGISGTSALGTGTVTINGGGIAGTASSTSLPNAVVLNSNVTYGGYGNSFSFKGATFDLGGGVRAMNIANTTTIYNAISNGGIQLDSASATRSLNLYGANTYRGGTIINNGILSLYNDSALGDASGTMTLNGGTLNLNAHSVTVGTLSGTAGTITSSAVGATNVSLTVNSANDGAFAGTITDGTGGNTLSVVKNGSGMVTLGDNSYSGGTTLNAGSIALKSSSALGTGTVTINGGTIGSVVSARTLTNNIVIGGDFAAGFGDSGNQTKLNGSVDLGGATRTVSMGNSLTFGGVVSNGGLTVGLSGTTIRTMYLSGANTYTGDTTVRNGAIVSLSGSIAGSVARVYDNSTLRGTGLAGAVNLYDTATLAAGPDVSTIGTLNTGALSMSGSSILSLKLNTATLASDKINVTGDFALDSNNSVVLSLSDLGGDQVLSAGSVFTLLSYSGAWNGNTFSGLADDSTITLGSNLFALSYNGVSGADSAVTLQVVPEPGAWSLITSGMGLLAFGARFRRRSLLR